jgi:2-methylaconitate cis-trans-isomerase PrpF
VGPFAIDEGLVKAIEPVTTIRIHNVNTGRIITAEVPVKDGFAAVNGDLVIDGAPGSGAKIMLDFSDCAGAATGRLLPTGHVKDKLKTPFGEIEASLVDCANAMVFVKASALGLSGLEGPKEIDSDRKLLDKLEHVRGAAAVAMGLATDPQQALVKSPAFPMLALVTAPADYQAFGSGQRVNAEDVSFVSRLMFMQCLHKTYAGTGAAATGAAACLPGTVVHETRAQRPQWGDRVRIGHPSGVIEVEARVENGSVKRAAFSRTARRLMEGYALVAQ